ncbi:MAG TPA: alkaline phosphatase family protein, partial [Terriglobales bacterium]|nr:alkaline phosphatase family protein [Terriglobales bacterium]
CTLILDTIWTGGEITLDSNPRTSAGPRMIIFALDGTTPDQLMQAIRSGDAPNLSALLGKERRPGLFEHAYAAPRAWSVLPSSTIAAWAAIFTGTPPAANGVTGDEWFERETATFHAPVPVSAIDTLDVSKVVSDDLIGKTLRSPTLFELIKKTSYVSLLSVHRGAAIYTTVSPASFTDFLSFLIKGTLKGIDPEKSFAAALDFSATQKLLEAIDANGPPDLQVVYFPGIDIFTHVSEDPLTRQERYLHFVTDKNIGDILAAYKKKNALASTYVIVISDHGQIPTLNDERHELNTDDEKSPFAVLKRSGFRVRKPLLTLPNLDTDFQAVFAYQGFMAYVYLADRSTCPQEHEACEWARPPRYKEDVLPALEAFDKANQRGEIVPELKGTIDLIFSREPAAPNQAAKPFQIFDGEKLVPIGEYLKRNRRQDLIDLEKRMQWLGAGPYGNRAGDILLLAKACTQLPIEQRFYFASVSHHTWHGSACEQDSHIPFILAQAEGSGERMRALMQKFAGNVPTQLGLVPLLRGLTR